MGYPGAGQAGMLDDLNSEKAYRSCSTVCCFDPSWCPMVVGWGLIAAIPYLAAGVSAMFRLVEPMSTVRVRCDASPRLAGNSPCSVAIAKGFKSNPPR